MEVPLVPVPEGYVSRHYGGEPRWLLERRFVRPCRELDAVVYFLLHGGSRTIRDDFDQSTGGYPSNRYSRYLPAALDAVADEMDTLRLESDCGELIAGVHRWDCCVIWDPARIRRARQVVIAKNPDSGLDPDWPEGDVPFEGNGTHEEPGMAIMLAVLDMYAVEIVDVLP